MTDKKQKQVKKYLTEIKELPSYEQEEGVKAAKESVEQTQPEIKPSEPKQEVLKEKVLPHSEAKVEINSKENGVGVDPQSSKRPVYDNTKRVFGIPFSVRDIILNIINLLTLVLLIVILLRLGDKAQQLREIRSENVRLSENYNYDTSQIEEDAQSAEDLRELFTSDSGVIDFVGDVENIQASGAILRVSFSSPDPVKDKTGSFGRPIVIQLRGSWQQIDQAITSIHNLPYLFRPVKFETVEQLQSESSTEVIWEVNYGGILYIEDPENAQAE